MLWSLKDIIQSTCLVYSKHLITVDTIIVVVVVGNTARWRPLGHLNWYQNPLKEETVFVWGNALWCAVTEEETLWVWTQQKMGQLLCWRHEKASVVLIPRWGGKEWWGRGHRRGEMLRQLREGECSPPWGCLNLVPMGRPHTPLSYAHLPSTQAPPLSLNFLDLGNSIVPWRENLIDVGAGTLCGDRGQAFTTQVSGEDQQRQHGRPRTQQDLQLALGLHSSLLLPPQRMKPSLPWE